MVYRIIYCSKSTLGNDVAQVNAAIEVLLEQSRVNNQTAGITGALLYNGRNFAQILEGPRTAVERIYESIRRDPRHTDVATLEHAYQPVHHFKEWRMAFCNEERCRRLAPTCNNFNDLRYYQEGFASLILEVLLASLNRHGSL